MKAKGIILQLKGEILPGNDFLKAILNHNFSESLYITVLGHDREKMRSFVFLKIYWLTNLIRNIREISFQW
jgi:hypothetical protein